MDLHAQYEYAQRSCAWTCRSGLATWLPKTKRWFILKASIISALAATFFPWPGSMCT